MKQLTIASIKDKLRKRYYALVGNPDGCYGPFEQRIKRRHKTFWSAPNAEAVRNTPMAVSDPLEEWKDVNNWQRKLSNKHNAREFAKMHGCRVPELYWRGRDHHRIDFGALPDRFVIRPTIGHSSGLVFLMDRRMNLMDRKTYTPENVQRILREALKQNPDLEFLVEEFLKDNSGKYRIPDDYKLYMFNGEVASIEVINRLSPKKGYSGFYDESWNQTEVLNTYYPEAAFQPPPACIEEMVGYAKKLSRAYGIFARIDFYATDKGAVFGEFTPTPSLGNGFTPAAEQTLVNYWDRYCKGMI